MKIRNISGEAREVPALHRVVPDDGVFEVSDADAEGFTCQPQTWRAEGVSKNAKQETPAPVEVSTTETKEA